MCAHGAKTTIFPPYSRKIPACRDIGYPYEICGIKGSLAKLNVSCRRELPGIGAAKSFVRMGPDALTGKSLRQNDFAPGGAVMGEQLA